MAIVSAQGLTHLYGSHVALDRVTLEVEEGALFGFLGPNGAGKSTAIRVLLGFLEPRSGTARIFGKDCWEESAAIKCDVGYLPGDLRLYRWMNLRRSLDVVGRIRGQDLMRSGMQLAERYRLDAEVSVKKMSRGMRQKLGLILTLAPDPPLLVLDEPTSGLDPLMQQELADDLRERAGRGRTVFFSSHTLSEVEDLCDHVAIIKAGRIVADESLDDLRGRARRSVTLLFADTRAASETPVPSFLELDVRSGARWQASLIGPVSELLAWSAQQGLRDMTLSQPDLESLFRRYYLDREESA